ncbi:MAG: hypothetical protein DI547_16175 [Sphingobium sp.]|nr:MAG: hypothetical protein DI547_16175 [Sphingobium sp.]
MQENRGLAIHRQFMRLAEVGRIFDASGGDDARLLDPDEAAPHIVRGRSGRSLPQGMVMSNILTM